MEVENSPCALHATLPVAYAVSAPKDCCILMASNSIHFLARSTNAVHLYTCAHLFCPAMRRLAPFANRSVPRRPVLGCFLSVNNELMHFKRVRDCANLWRSVHLGTDTRASAVLFTSAWSRDYFLVIFPNENNVHTHTHRTLGCVNAEQLKLRFPTNFRVDFSPRVYRVVGGHAKHNKTNAIFHAFGLIYGTWNERARSSLVAQHAFRALASRWRAERNQSTQ